jgi:hypothetical protein
VSAAPLSPWFEPALAPPPGAPAAVVLSPPIAPVLPAVAAVPAVPAATTLGLVLELELEQAAGPAASAQATVMTAKPSERRGISVRLPSLAP